MQESIELPGSKGLKDEAFGALQLLMPGDFVRVGKHLYAFARAMDDIADALSLPVEGRLLRLEKAEAVLRGDAPDTVSPTTAAVRDAFADRGLSLHGCKLLLDGFRRDIDPARFQDIDEVALYVRQSSAAFSLYMMEFHQEAPELNDAAIHLGMALQMLKLVKDGKKDWQQYGRVYVPGIDNPEQAGEAFVQGQSGMLLAAGQWLEDTCILLDHVQHKRLLIMIEVLQAAATRWREDLEKGDPWQREIDLDWSVVMATGMKAVAMQMFAKD